MIDETCWFWTFDSPGDEDPHTWHHLGILAFPSKIWTRTFSALYLLLAFIENRPRPVYFMMVLIMLHWKGFSHFLCLPFFSHFFLAPTGGSRAC